MNKIFILTAAVLIVGCGGKSNSHSPVRGGSIAPNSTTSRLTGAGVLKTDVDELSVSKSQKVVTNTEQSFIFKAEPSWNVHEPLYEAARDRTAVHFYVVRSQPSSHTAGSSTTAVTNTLFAGGNGQEDFRLFVKGKKSTSQLKMGDKIYIELNNQVFEIGEFRDVPTGKDPYDVNSSPVICEGDFKSVCSLDVSIVEDKDKFDTYTTSEIVNGAVTIKNLKITKSEVSLSMRIHPMRDAKTIFQNFFRN